MNIVFRSWTFLKKSGFNQLSKFVWRTTYYETRGNLLMLKKLKNRRFAHNLIRFLANLYYQEGKYFLKINNILTTLQSWDKCLLLCEFSEYRQLEMLVIQSLGNAYNDCLYDRIKAIDYLQKSLKIAEEVQDEKMQGRLQGDLSAAYADLAVNDDDVVDKEKINLAIHYAQNSLNISQKYLNIAQEYQDIEAKSQVLDDSDVPDSKKIEIYQQIIKIARQSQISFATIEDLHNLGEVYLSFLNYKNAMICFRWALQLAQKLKNAQQEAMEWVALGRVAKQQQNIAEAINYYKKGIEIAENIRSTIKIEENTASFVNFWARHYRSLILLLWQQGLVSQQVPQQNYFQEAFEFVERSKARAFLDKVANARIGKRGRVKAYLLKQEQALRKQIFALRRKGPNHQLSDLEKDYKNLLEKSEIRNRATASLISVDVVCLAQIQEKLDTQTTLLEYFVTDERTLAFIITRDRFQAINLDVTRDKLQKQITLFRGFADTSEAYPPELKQLYTYLIAPLKSQLNTPRLIIVPHNILHYLPFAALIDGERYLIDDYALVNLPCANVLRFLPKNKQHSPSAKILLGLGAPDNTFDKLLSPLNAARNEVEAIASLFNTKAYIGKDATESRVWSEAKNAEILHIAAHGEYNPNAPLFSTIHLAQDDNAEVAQKDGRLEVHDVYRLDLTTVTNLVVLSACQTHIGNTQKVSLGDEIIGLNRAFIYAGTPSVIASLWNVEDQATELLMKQFYQNLQDGMDKAKALQQAQIKVRENAHHPHYWAAFVLTGDGEKIHC
ncbi:hypothetical protein B4U84_19520 [Westiellopsis prolifica IICB1]|nr:hypothetical protein B4U84_19520 [Westiellopsis prolifica IICB1]